MTPYCSVAFLLGACLLLPMSTVPSWPWIMGACVIALSLLWFLHQKMPLILYPIFFLWGFAWTSMDAHHVLDWQLPQALNHKTISIQGQVVDLPATGHHRESFLFLMDHLDGKKLTKGIRIKLSRFGRQTQPLLFGSRWAFTVRLHPIGPMNNPSKHHYGTPEIRAAGYVVQHRTQQPLPDDPGYHLTVAIGRFRQHLAQKLAQALEGKTLGGIIVSLAVGDRQGITPAQWQVLRRTGTAHLVAISGLHVGLIASFFFGLSFQCLRCFPRLSRRWPAQHGAGLLSLCFSIFYSVLAGFAISTERALCMISIAIILQQKRYVTNTPSIFLSTLMLVLLVHPLSIYSMSFWLSFSAVALILLAVHSMPSCCDRNWKKGLFIQTFLFFGMMPLNFLLFKKISLVSFFANLIAIPYMSFVVITLTLFGTMMVLMHLPWGPVLLSWAEYTLGYLWHLLHWFSGLPMAIWP